MPKPIHIASRTSLLAKVMTNAVITELEKQTSLYCWEILDIKTDNKIDPTDPNGIKGVFTNALEESIRQKKSRLAVHSAKDLPSRLNEDMVIAAYLKRGDPRDVLISKKNASLKDLPSHSIIGTASLRRKMLIEHLRPDLKTASLRGNIDSRIKKLNEYDAIVLAASGLERLGINNVITEHLDPKIFIPAAGQGAIAVTCLKEDLEMQALLKPLNDEKTQYCVEIERNICHALDLSCHAPIGVFATQNSGLLQVHVHLTLNDNCFHDVFSAQTTNAQALVQNIIDTITQRTR